jgi:REP element-mobilizing transposase RayT
MSEDKYKNRYRIPSARAAWHDYMGGAYFVTICTKDREFYFGKIENNEVHLSEIGRYADEQFRDVSSNYPYAVIPSYVVMPNHIHAIVIIDDHYDVCRDAIHRVSETIHRVSESEMQMVPTQDRGGITGRSNPMLYQSLGTVIRGLKARVTHYANEKGLDFAWQSRFHDRIIRDQKDMNETALYVDNNVAKWPEDEMHP